MTIVWSLVTGIICGAVFTALKLPLPAPAVVEGIAGIVGIFIGMVLINLLRRIL